MIRLFVAIPVPEPALSALQARLRDLRSRKWPVRWVREEGLHLTLKFLGWVEDTRADDMATAMREAGQGTGSIPVTLDGVGAFSSGRRARVIWMGVEAPAALELLQDRIERAYVPLGFPVSGRAFRPHVTLGRVERDRRLPVSEVETVPPSEPIVFLAEALVLFASRPGRGGSVYLPHTVVPLN